MATQSGCARDAVTLNQLSFCKAEFFPKPTHRDGIIEDIEEGSVFAEILVPLIFKYLKKIELEVKMEAEA